MPRGWPPLSKRELLAILTALNFSYDKSAGGHDFYVAEHGGRRWKITVDQKITTFGPELLQSMCKQPGYGRVAFYGATKATAAKIK